MDNNSVQYYTFLSQINYFLNDLLKNPINCKINDFFIMHGISKQKLLSLLKKRGIIIPIEKVDDANSPTFKIKYKIPRKNFERKIRRLYIKLFEKNLPNNSIIENECSTGGATSASAVNNTAPISPLGNIQRKRIYITNEQLIKLEESTTTFNTGNYQYDVPFLFKNNKKDEAYIHRKKNGIIVNYK